MCVHLTMYVVTSDYLNACMHTSFGIRIVAVATVDLQTSNSGSNPTRGKSHRMGDAQTDAISLDIWSLGERGNRTGSGVQTTYV